MDSRGRCYKWVEKRCMNSIILSRSLMQLHPARVPDSIRIATLRAAYDSPGVTDVSAETPTWRRRRGRDESGIDTSSPSAGIYADW